MRSAGGAESSAAVIRHRGRRSGRTYETPVRAVATDEGFVIALLFGPRANWPRNVLASGSATIVRDGRSYAVERPEVVAIQDVASSFLSDRRLRLFRVDRALRVRTVQSDAAAERTERR